MLIMISGGCLVVSGSILMMLIVVSGSLVILGSGLVVVRLVSGWKSHVINNLGIFYGLHQVGRLSKADFCGCVGLQAFDKQVEKDGVIHLNFKLQEEELLGKVSN